MHKLRLTKEEVEDAIALPTTDPTQQYYFIPTENPASAAADPGHPADRQSDRRPDPARP
nr:hypothetical protein [Mycolicibacterium sp.]